MPPQIEGRRRMHGPTLPISQQTHAQKYREEGEDYREYGGRVSNALTDTPEEFLAFREDLLTQRTLPAGRIQKAAGSLRGVTMYNCFVSGTIQDSFVSGEGNIMQRLTEAVTTMRLGGGIGYEFSTLRPQGSMIKKLGSKSSGPLAFMEMFDAGCGCVKSAGDRRGAQMGTFDIHHPDIMDFIHAKQGSGRFKNFNLSVLVTDEFMTALRAGSSYELRFNGESHGSASAQVVWDAIMRSTFDYAEPGVIFIDRINQRNNLRYCETIRATNPCGEQPLPPYGACLLGSINLTKFVVDDLSGKYRRVIDLVAVEETVKRFVRALDNVVDRSIYPLPQQRAEALSKRRMGIGVTGLANAIEAILERPSYGDDDFVELQDRVMRKIARTAYLTSIELAKEKGVFPLFDRDKYLDAGTFASGLDDEIQQGIWDHGIHNSHLLSVAPTGTISLSADNVSSGCEPVFLHEYNRTIIMDEGPRTETVDDYGVRVFGVRGRTTDEVTVEQHIRVLAKATEWVDSAVSKTVNIPRGYSFEQFKKVYDLAYDSGCKGCTTFNPDGKLMGILTAKDETEGKAPETCYIDFSTGKRECA
jgi:ribonucleoside-diphosphate reductase alpha chain